MAQAALQKTHTESAVKDMVYIALFAALIAVCSWITIPFTVPFTLQTFGVFTAVEVLGGKRGSLAVLVYILLGAAGLPVFSGFRGGPGVLLASTGGYIIGFLAGALVMWLLESLTGKMPFGHLLRMISGLIVCYAFGTAWFMHVYSSANGPTALMTVLGWCVFPFIIPDLAKIILVSVLAPRIRKLAGIH